MNFEALCNHKMVQNGNTQHKHYCFGLKKFRYLTEGQSSNCGNAQQRHILLHPLDPLVDVA